MKSHHVSLAVVLAVLVAGPSVQAQEQTQTRSQAGPTRAELENIFVIGTRVGDRTALDTPVPVDVLGANELRASGAVAGEVGQALAVLSPSFNFPRQSISTTCR